MSKADQILEMLNENLSASLKLSDSLPTKVKKTLSSVKVPAAFKKGYGPILAYKEGKMYVWSSTTDEKAAKKLEKELGDWASDVEDITGASIKIERFDDLGPYKGASWYIKGLEKVME